VVEAAGEVVGEELLGSVELAMGSAGWGNNRRRLPPVRCSHRKTTAGESHCPASLAGATGKLLVQEGRGDGVLTHLLAKDSPFVFMKQYLQSFHTLKKALIFTPIIRPPDWHLPFEIMCDASDYAIRAVLGQSKDKKHYAIS
jgi:hypothetical protein